MLIQKQNIFFPVLLSFLNSIKNKNPPLVEVFKQTKQPQRLDINGRYTKILRKKCIFGTLIKQKLYIKKLWRIC